MATIADYQNLIIADAPLLYWPLNDGGITADDLSGNSRSGTIGTNGGWANPPTASLRGDYSFVCSGASSNALQYSGTMDTLNAVGLSVEFWICPATISGASVYHYIHGLGGWSEFGGIGSSTGSFNIGTNLSSRLSTSLAATTWQHIVFTQDAAGSSKLYKNNVLVDGPTTKTRPTQDMTGFCIDNNNTNHTDYWQHVAVYDKVLTATNVSDRYTLAMDYSFTVVATAPILTDRDIVVIPAGGGGVAPPIQPHQKWPLS